MGTCCKGFGKHWIVFSFMQRFAWLPQGVPRANKKWRPGYVKIVIFYRKLIASFVDKSCMKLRKWITKRYGYLTMLRWITLRLYGHKVILFFTDVDCGRAGKLRCERVRLNIVFMWRTVPYTREFALHSYTYNGRPIESRIKLWSIERRYFQLPWTTTTHSFKITPFFDAEYLRNGTRYIPGKLPDTDILLLKY